MMSLLNVLLIQLQSNTGSILALLSGFTFTAFTLLLTQLPDRSNIASQFTLVFLAGLFYLFMSLLSWGPPFVMRHCRNVPPASKAINTYNSLILLSHVGLELVMVLMPLIWNLIYVALASGALLAIFIILTNIHIWKPLMKYRKTIH